MKEMTIFENDFIKVSTTGNDFDFIAVVENITYTTTTVIQTSLTQISW